MVVEFAIVMLLFLYLVFGVLEAGRYLMARWMVTYATERGGRVAALRSTPTVAAVQTAVVQTASPLIGITTGNVTVSVNAGARVFTARTTGDSIRVTVAYTFNRVVPFIFKTSTIVVNGYTTTTME